MPLTPGTTLGPYEILSPIGAGGMGEVYKATDTRLDRTVAIKVLLAQVADDPDLRQRFEREAQQQLDGDVAEPRMTGLVSCGACICGPDTGFFAVTRKYPPGPVKHLSPVA